MIKEKWQLRIKPTQWYRNELRIESFSWEFIFDNKASKIKMNWELINDNWEIIIEN